jgi:hypothetical protein
LPKKDYLYFARISIKERDWHYILKNLKENEVRSLIEDFTYNFLGNNKVIDLVLSNEKYSSVFVNSIFHDNLSDGMAFKKIKKIKYLDLDKVDLEKIDKNVRAIFRNLFNQDVNYFRNTLKDEMIKEFDGSIYSNDLYSKYHYLTIITFIIRTNNLEVIKENIDIIAKFGFEKKYLFKQFSLKMLNNATLNEKHNVEIIHYLLDEMDRQGCKGMPFYIIKAISLSNIKDEALIDKVIQAKENFSNLKLFNSALNSKNLNLCKILNKDSEYVMTEARKIETKSKKKIINSIFEEVELERKSKI